MVNFNVGSVADFAYNRIDEVPSTVSGTVMQQYAQLSVYQLGNWLGTTLTTTSFDEKYMPFLVEYTVAQTLARMHGIGADFNWALGQFNVSKGTGASSETLQVEVAMKNAELALKILGRPMKVYASFYG